MLMIIEKESESTIAEADGKIPARVTTEKIPIEMAEIDVTNTGVATAEDGTAIGRKGGEIVMKVTGMVATTRKSPVRIQQMITRVNGGRLKY